MPFVLGGATYNGDGTSPAPATTNGGAGAFNVPPSNAFSTGTWEIVAGGQPINTTTFGLTCGNNAIIRKYGQGPDPIITNSNTNVVNADTATGVSFTDIVIERLGGTTGAGLRATRTTGLQFTRGRITGSQSNILGDQAVALGIDGTRFTGDGTSYVLKAIAGNNSDSANWRILNTIVECGGGIDLKTSTSGTVYGGYTGMRIAGNKFALSTVGHISLATGASAETGSVSVTAPSTVTSSVAWPAWPNGKKVFLAGFSDRANFGLFTVASVAGTVLTLVETALVSEGPGINKGVHLRDPQWAYADIEVVDNESLKAGATPLLLNGLIRGQVSRNKVLDAYGTGTLSAGIEFINCLGTLAERNYINKIRAPNEDGDVMGLMFDGASENCVGRRNKIRDLLQVGGVSNSGAGIALFESLNCLLYGNDVADTHRGIWIGGPGTRGRAFNNTYRRTQTGIVVNSSPAANAIELRNELVIDSTVTTSISATSLVDNIAYWNNGSGPTSGNAPVTSNPLVTADSMLLSGSPLRTSGYDLGQVRDFDGKQGRKFIGAYTAARLRLPPA